MVIYLSENMKTYKYIPRQIIALNKRLIILHDIFHESVGGQLYVSCRYSPNNGKYVVLNYVVTLAGKDLWPISYVNFIQKHMR